MELSHKIIISLLVILILLTVYKKQENAGSTPAASANYNTEAVQNIASVYSESLNGTASFNNLRVTNNINFAQFKGIIVAWSGAITNIPSGWGLCDGTKYTALDGTELQSPDLRGRFILAAGQGTGLANRIVNDKGGAETHTLTTAEIPGHTHAASKSCMGSDPIGDWSTYTDLRSTHGWNCADRSGKPILTNWGNDPSTGTSLGGGAHNNMPPFYALAYIIKL